MPSEAQMAKFMYYIVKQLDVRSVDWNLVASDMEITNGHAARMRFARFKNQMEGTVPKARTPRDKTKAPKAKRAKTKDEKKEEDGSEKALVKLEVEEGTRDTAVERHREQTVARSPVVKPEPTDEIPLGDADAPGELVDESQLPHHSTHVTTTPTHTLVDPNNNSVPPHLIATPVHHSPSSQESPYDLSMQRRPSLDFSPASTFSFSHDLMPQGLFMQSMDGSESHGGLPQDLHMTPVTSFYDPYLFSSQPQMLVDGQGRLVKGEPQWDTSFC